MRSMFTTVFLALSLTGTAFAQGQPTEPGLSKKAPDMPPAGTHPAEMKGAPAGAQMGSIKMAKVRFLTPMDNETVAKTFKMKFAVEGLKVAPAGEITPGSGHFHVIVDDPGAKEGDVIPADAKHVHFGKGQTEAEMTLTPGAHTLTLQFADGAHRAYGPMLMQTIHVTVK